ncbi:ribbon-helix-helix domain-containing protein [Aureimonas sp. AU4]|uniref:ribbon-helix-helix domain-containing protein n=1 Tax=Aureimonas sp. AU4 TaxID=1638163 RepID=UPI00078526B0|nr:ribbon-helix-helix domain-containing protein [Aureimonas sp. AU4]
MCHVFSGIPQAEYEGETRSVRLGGHATSIRLETMYWSVLEELAASQHMTLPRFLTVLYDEVLELHGEARNFASLLRCACLKHAQASGRAQAGRVLVAA